MRKIALNTLLLLVLVAFSTKMKGQNPAKDFKSFKEYYIETFWTMFPDYAMYVGYHKYDGELQIPNEDTRTLKLKTLHSYEILYHIMMLVECRLI